MQLYSNPLMLSPNLDSSLVLLGPQASVSHVQVHVEVRQHAELQLEPTVVLRVFAFQLLVVRD